MKRLNDILQAPRLTVFQATEQGGFGTILLCSSGKDKTATVIWSIDKDSSGEKWEHVSIALPSRDPLWSEMCEVKDTFFYADEECIQLHPKASEYVNLHPHCLHIWRSQDGDMKLPK